MLSRLRVADRGSNPERGGAVTNVGSGHHGVEEGWVVVHTNILDLQRVDFSTGLLVEEVLLHGFIDFFSRHFIGKVTAQRFVDFVHVGGDVLTGQDGRRTEDPHRLTPVVVGIRRVASCTRIEPIVNGKVADFVVTADGFAGSTFVILHSVETLKVDQIIVEVVDGVVGIGVKGLGQQLGHHGKACVVAVNAG